MNTGRIAALHLRRTGSVDALNVLAVTTAVLGGFFILTGTWITVPVMAVLASLGLEAVLRSHPTGRLRSLSAAAAQLLAPVGLAVATVLFFRWVATGYWGVAGALLAGLLFGVTAYASYLSLDAGPGSGAAVHTTLALSAYLGVFGLISVFYAFDLTLAFAALLSGLTGAVFSVELYRDADATAGELLTFSLCTGFVLAQVRFAMGYLRVDGVLAAVLLLLVFYVGTGLVLAAATRKLDRRVGLEFGVVGAAGLLCIIAGRLIVAR